MLSVVSKEKLDNYAEIYLVGLVMSAGWNISCNFLMGS